jgi:hypothetical protein
MGFVFRKSILTTEMSNQVDNEWGRHGPTLRAEKGRLQAASAVKRAIPASPAPQKVQKYKYV